MKSPLFEESSFAVLFPHCRERDLTEIWPRLTPAVYERRVWETEFVRKYCSNDKQISQPDEKKSTKQINKAD